MKKEQTKEQERPAVELVRFQAYKAAKGPLRGFATVRVGCVVIKDIQVLEFKEDDITIQMPSTKGVNKDGKEEYFPNVWIDCGNKEANKHVYDDITKVVVDAYPG